MVSVNFQNNVKVCRMSGTNKVQTAPFPTKVNSDDKDKKSISFKSVEGYQSVVSIRTELATSDEKKKYKEISEELNSAYKKKLEYALKTGILLKNNSDDKSSVLDNLHKILKEERDPGLDGRTILKEALDIIHNPYVITQKCEDIPDEYIIDIQYRLGLMYDERSQIYCYSCMITYRSDLEEYLSLQKKGRYK